LVSRDGTRFVAVVRSGGRDELRLGRIEVGPRGRIDRIGRTEEIALQPGVPVRIRDVAWSAPSRLALLVRLDPAGLFEVRTVSVDGSPASVEALPTVTEPLSGLVGSPRAGLPLYGTTRTGLIDLAEGGPYGFVGGTPSSIAYVG
ncbi:LpqB family beta-propeller domain-containing protein, partial [Achromobacter xylosoxidans]|uniref:LpqB family beta-propeller domain-containing protein n=1 Tax=Alcaligenes xylosoxydans xylosoxydans TaxID=85698 RepID=UPI001F0684AC